MVPCHRHEGESADSIMRQESKQIVDYPLKSQPISLIDREKFIEGLGVGTPVVLDLFFGTEFLA